MAAGKGMGEEKGEEPKAVEVVGEKPAKQANITWLMYVAIALIIIGLSGMTYVYFSIRRYKKAFAVDDASYDEEIDEV